MVDEAPVEIVERMRLGETAALAEAFALLRPRLWRTIHFRLDRRLAGRLDADDILQEAYMNAARRLPHFGEKQELSCFLWLRMITNQTLVDFHRRHLGAQRRDAGRERSIHRGGGDDTSGSLAGMLLAELTSPSGVAVRHELTTYLENALESMDEIDRETLALRHFEELTNGEVAEVLGISKTAASNRYARALVRLREILADAPGFGDE